MPGPRMLIRFLVGAALSVALMACAVLPVPDDPPAVALEQAGLYRLEVALVAFYGLLLLATPAYSGLVAGRLPIEISTRGARFAEGADESAHKTKAAIEGLEDAADRYENELAAVHLKIERLELEGRRDITQPKVGSKP